MTTTGPSTAAPSPGPAAVEAGRVTAAMVRLTALADDCARWSADERRATLRQLDRAIDGLVAVRAAVLVAERESGTWQGAGDRSFAAWRARTARSGERAAAAQVRQAEQLGAVPFAAAAVVSGRIGLEHAAEIAKLASTGTSAQRSAAQCPEGQQHLLQLAEGLDAGTFAITVARWASTVDPDGLERDHEVQRRERFLQVADTPRATFLKGRLDSIAGHRLRLALEALSPRPAADDDRDAGQRCADALDAMAGRILAAADTKPGGHVPPQVSFIVTAETWAAALAERDRRRRAGTDGGGTTCPDAAPGPGAGTPWTGSSTRDGASGNGAPSEAGGPGEAGRVTGAGESVSRYAPATLEDGRPVPVSELAQVMCDCDITRIVIDAGGVPRDLGRTERLFSREQRRAVIARDRECIWPDCHAHARWCEVHHIRWWERDAGPTSIDNGAIVCAFHHHEVHRRDLSITRLVLATAPGQVARGRPRHGLASVAYEFRDPAGRLVRATEPARESVGADGHGSEVGVAPARAQVLTGSRPGAGNRAATRRNLDAPATAPPAGATPAAHPPEATAPPATAPPASATPAAHAQAAPSRGRALDADELDLRWTTDPFTGMRVPAAFVHR